MWCILLCTNALSKRQFYVYTQPWYLLYSFYQIYYLSSFVLVEEVGKDSEDAKKENQYQHTSSSAKSSDSSSSNTSDGKRKDVKTRKPAVSMAAISPEEKKQLTDKVVEQLLTNSKQSQACVLL